MFYFPRLLLGEKESKKKKKGFFFTEDELPSEQGKLCVMR